MVLGYSGYPLLTRTPLHWKNASKTKYAHFSRWVSPHCCEKCRYFHVVSVVDWVRHRFIFCVHMFKTFTQKQYTKTNKMKQLHKHCIARRYVILPPTPFQLQVQYSFVACHLDTHNLNGDASGKVDNY